MPKRKKTILCSNTVISSYGIVYQNRFLYFLWSNWVGAIESRGKGRQHYLHAGYFAFDMLERARTSLHVVTTLTKLMRSAMPQVGRGRVHLLAERLCVGIG